jgi:leucyl-tRNA synthetase
MADQINTTDSTPKFRYTAELAGLIEPKWQAWWDENATYHTLNPGDDGFDASKPKFYALDMFPYPSGAGLHVGHPEGYTATDIISRYKKMRGFNVLHPMGFDAFGLPAEQHAINTGEHPSTFTRKTIDNFRRQLKRFGFCYDWSREIATIDEDYYRWTQWIFIKIYNSWFDDELCKCRPIDELIKLLESGTGRVSIEGDLVRITKGEKATEALGGEPVGIRQWHELDAKEQRTFIDNQRLAYVGEQSVNWCPALGTVLANEEVIDGRSERGGHPVLRKPMKQWLFRITALADRLLTGLDELDWPESTKTQQREWIGKSEGAEVDFELDLDLDNPNTDTEYPPAIRVFTTRPDTIFGATYMVLAPEHDIVAAVLSSPRDETPADELAQYVQAAKNRSDKERLENKEKTGCFTGLYAINPATGEKIPVWTSDYVLASYGFGAIMAVPAHDKRDYEFALNFGLPILDVVYPRTMLAMAYFTKNANEEETTTDQWKQILADFLGLVTTSTLPPEVFPEVLEAIRARREQNTGPVFGTDGRGTIREEYESSLEDLGVESFTEFREIFREGRFFKHTGASYAGVGYAVNSTNDLVSLDNLDRETAIPTTIKWLDETGIGRRRINYRLRDWLFSRQRYWGEPFPIVFDEDGNHHAVSEDKLPVVLPKLEDYKPVESEDPQPLLGKVTDWINTTADEAGVEGLDPGATVRREANTMPGWAGSCWYHISYLDSKNNDAMVGSDVDSYWLGAGGVDLYVGGAEHAVLHLLYARFWHMILHDLGHIKSAEPYRKLFHQGMITSHAFQRSDKSLVAVDMIDERDGKLYELGTDTEVSRTIAKMSKSLKNVINPDDIIEEFGADTFRIYEMYMGPLEASKPWNTDDTVGLYRFLQRAWRMCVDESTGEIRLNDSADAAIEKQLHRTIAKVGEDIDRMSLNTAIAAMIEFVNLALKSGVTRDQMDRFVRVLAPFAPHITEELWHKLGNEGSVAHADWPGYEESMLVDDEVEIAIQVLGKVKAKLSVPTGASEDELRELALKDETIAGLIDGKTVRKVVVVPGRLVNIVAN